MIRKQITGLAPSVSTTRNLPGRQRLSCKLFEVSREHEQTRGGKSGVKVSRTAQPRQKTAQTDGGAQAAGRQHFTTIKSRAWTAASTPLCLKASWLWDFEQITNVSEPLFVHYKLGLIFSAIPG